MGKDVIIALDFDSKEKTLAFLDRFTGKKPFVKIGMEPKARPSSARSRPEATRSSSISSCTTSPTPSKRPWPSCPRWTWIW